MLLHRCYTQQIRTEWRDAPKLILSRMVAALEHWRERAILLGASPKMKRIPQYYEEEIEAHKKRWFDGS
jgi:hypothetical protein